MAGFTNIGLDTYILLCKYSYTSAAFHLMISSTPRFEPSACQNQSKTLDMSSALIRVALSKALAILSDTTVRRYTAEQEGMTYWKSEKRPHFSK